MKALEIKHLTKRFGGVKAVQDFSMELEERNIVSIIGPNGAGKTTIFNLISGIYKLDGGTVNFFGEKISGKEQYEITGFGLARTFQNIRLFKGLSVLENVMTARDYNAKYNLFEAILNTGKKKKIDIENKEKSIDCLKIVGLQDLKNEKPENLPYGLQRKLEIARALATEPKVLLLDEPAAGLNPSEIRDFIHLVQKLSSDLGLSVLLIEHRMQVVMELSKWIYVLNFGQLLAEGTYKDIQNNDEVIKAYIGEDD